MSANETGCDALRAGEESELLSRLRQRDVGAFAQLFRDHSAVLLRLACALCPTLALAEEVVQDTWLAVLEGLDRFQGRSAVGTWMFSIAVHRAKAKATQEQRFVPFSSLPAEPPPSEESQRSPEHGLLSAEARGMIDRSVGTLPLGQRWVVTLRDVHGMSAPQVCQLLRITDNHQRVLLHRGRLKLRAALAGYLAGGGMGSVDAAPGEPPLNSSASRLTRPGPENKSQRKNSA